VQRGADVGDQVRDRGCWSQVPTRRSAT
jgi:hypothetical protein